MCTARTVVLLLLAGVAGAQEAGRKTESPMLSIKTLCVDQFVGEAMSQAREFAIASLFAAKLFKVTENCGAADAVIKGAVLEKTTQRVRSERENAFGVGGGLPGGAVGGSESLASSEARTEAYPLPFALRRRMAR